MLHDQQQQPSFCSSLLLKLALMSDQHQLVAEMNLKPYSMLLVMAAHTPSNGHRLAACMQRLSQPR